MTKKTGAIVFFKAMEAFYSKTTTKKELIEHRYYGLHRIFISKFQNFQTVFLDPVTDILNIRVLRLNAFCISFYHQSFGFPIFHF